MRRLLATLVIAVTACAPSAASEAAVTLSEFDIAVSSRLAAGAVTLRVANSGQFGHTLVVSAEDGTVIASTEVLDPGSAASLDLEVEPGRYMFSCRIVVETPDGNIVDHYARGMAASVQVTGP